MRPRRRPPDRFLSSSTAYNLNECGLARHHAGSLTRMQDCSQSRGGPAGDLERAPEISLERLERGAGRFRAATRSGPGPRRGIYVQLVAPKYFIAKNAIDHDRSNQTLLTASQPRGRDRGIPRKLATLKVGRALLAHSPGRFRSRREPSVLRNELLRSMHPGHESHSNPPDPEEMRKIVCKVSD